MAVEYQTEEDRNLAVVAYVLTFVTGLLVFLLGKKEYRFARWHAVQAIGLGLAWIVGNVLFGVLDGILPRFLPDATDAWNLLLVIAVIVLAVKAFRGEKTRLPVVAEFADRYA